MKRENRAYCLLYPNVGGEFPFPIKNKDIQIICKVEDLYHCNAFKINKEHYLEVLETFHKNDLCFIGKYLNVVVSLAQEDDHSNQLFSAARWMDAHLDDIPAHLEENIEIFKSKIDFNFDEEDTTHPWSQIHLHMINGLLEDYSNPLPHPIEQFFRVVHHHIPEDDYRFTSSFEWIITAGHKEICRLPFKIKEFSEFHIEPFHWEQYHL